MVIPRCGVFKDGRHSKRAGHISDISGVIFDTTDVGMRIQHFLSQPSFGRTLGLIEGRFGDPTCYPDLGPYLGYERHIARSRFYPARIHSGYNMSGYQPLKEFLRQGRKHIADKLQVPDHVEAFITAGVAGALRLISDAILFPNQGGEPDNVVVPQWTYPSHLAETYRAHGQVKICPITKDGQIDLNKLKETIDKNTRTVLFATVGNPLSVAMEPEYFDNVLRIVSAKMKEYGQPIIVIADTIYEPFRRGEPNNRIDPIQRALRLRGELNPPVPVIATSSFSKMMAIPGQRVGYFTLYWEPETFANERYNFIKALNLLYSPTLCPVSQQAQWALAMLYSDINAEVPVDEKFVPIAAALTALKRLQGTKSASPDAPEGFYDVNLDIEEMYSAMLPHLKDGDYGLRVPARVREHLDSILDVTIDKIKLIEMKDTGGRSYYRLVADVPDLPLARDEDGDVIYSGNQTVSRLYGIVHDPNWYRIARACKIPTETEKYNEHKKHMRETVFSRTMYFVEALDRLKDEGIYLHPAYYAGGDTNGKVMAERINAFYVLWGMSALRRYVPDGLSQAARLVEECVKVGGPMIANTPGELFLPPESRSDKTSYQRHVALLDNPTTDVMIDTIRKVVRQL